MGIGSKMNDYRTNPTLLADLKAAAQRGLTSAEVKGQRVSYVMSTLKDSDTETKAQVERVLESSGN